MKVPVDATPVAITDEEKASKDNGWQHLYFVEYRPTGCKWTERPPLDLLRVWTDREVDRAQPRYTHGWPMLRWHSMAKTKLVRWATANPVACGGLTRTAPPRAFVTSP